MKDISVEQLAEIVGTPPDKILLQMKEAGLTQSSSSDLVTDKDKKVLLEFLKSQQTKSSKTIKLNIKINEEKQYENLFIKILKCKNSEFDDNPEVTAYLQVRDITMKDNDKVFIFNGWTFSSSPSIRPFDHPVYDIWLLKCF